MYVIEIGTSIERCPLFYFVPSKALLYQPHLLPCRAHKIKLYCQITLFLHEKHGRLHNIMGLQWYKAIGCRAKVIFVLPCV